MNYKQSYQWLHGDRTEYSGCRAAADAMDAEVKRLRQSLANARSGFALAYDAAEKRLNDEVLLHCGHHEAMAAKALDA